MARRFILVAIAAAFAALSPTAAYAVTAPASAPTLTSNPYVATVTISWTPSTDPLDLSQNVMRASGSCTNPVSGGTAVNSAPLASNVQTFTDSNVPDGTWCYYVEIPDLLQPADSPGLTVVVDTINPTGTVAVSPETPGGLVSQTVTISGTSSDATSGVRSSVFLVSPHGTPCANGSPVGSSWDTTEFANGSYDVCNFITDQAGHDFVPTITVTVDNPVAPPPTPPVTTPPPATKGPLKPPPAPTKITVVLPRSKQASATVPVTIRWVNPTVSDLDRVVVVLNRSRAPRTPGDGRVIYHGLKTSAVVSMRPGQLAYVALYAYDKSGVISKPARKTVSLAALVPLRPLTGSTLTKSPLLTWTAKKGTAYYNVQIFRKGKRVLVGWPTTASFQVPASKLQPGTYTWFVWPAIEHANAPATFAKQLGHATFKYAPS